MFLITGVMLSLISCHTSKKTVDKIVSENINTNNLSGTWQLEMVFASDNHWPKAPFLNFDVKNKTYSGNSGCNSISGKFIINESYLAFDKNIISTKMSCQGNYEKTFLSALLKINRFTIIKDEMELGQGEIVLIRFKRKQN